jgi:hypothetical protein
MKEIFSMWQSTHFASHNRGHGAFGKPDKLQEQHASMPTVEEMCGRPMLRPGPITVTKLISNVLSLLQHHEQVYKYIQTLETLMFTSDTDSHILEIFQQFCSLKS